MGNFFSFQLSATLECSVCRQLIDGYDPEARQAIIVGAEAYYLCPCCHQTSPNPKSKAYRKRCDNFFKEKTDAI